MFALHCTGGTDISLLPFSSQKLVEKPKNLMIINRKVIFPFSIFFQYTYYKAVRYWAGNYFSNGAT